MRTRVEKRGNSLAVRISRSFAVEGGLEPGAAVEMTLEGGSLVVRSVRRRDVRLADMLAGVTEDNLHGRNYL
ncbi:MAG: hypothetical protein U5K81_13820 [Trueperaceae bacterium]|nr:hypothetical protein [Trueperaceae bacterium]